jgi:hypothetical protein
LEKIQERKGFAVLNGTISKISKTDGLKTYFIKGSEKFYIAEKQNTFYLDGEVKVGDKIIAFAEERATARKLPVYNAAVIAKLLADRSVKTDRFDENLISSDGKLKLNPGENTEIILQNGESFPLDGLANRKLAVVYGAATKSIPAITTPDKIVVLFEDVVPLR